MAQTVKDTTLDSRTARGRLAVRGKPYYRAIDPGVHLGYRRNAGGGVWLARLYIGDGKYRLEKIGTADDKADADGVAILSFAQAQAAARKLHVGVARAAAGLPAVSTGPLTVATALDDYVAWLEGDGRNRHSIRDLRTKAASAIKPQLGHVRVDRLTRAQIEHWFHAMAKTPPRVRTAPGAKVSYRKGVDMRDPEVRRKRRASANRLLTILRAALTHAWRNERVPSDAAWRRLKAFKGTMQSRARFLQLDDCQRLLNAADADFRQVVYAGLHTGCRWGELRRLAPADFNATAGTLTIHRSKSGKPRHVVLTDDGAEFFKQAVVRAGQRAHLFVRDDGKPWGANWQVPLMLATSQRAGIEPPATFHLLRHSFASHSLLNGAALPVIARQLGHATIEMAQRHYAHLTQDFVANEIRRTAPRFKSVSDGVVTRLRTR